MISLESIRRKTGLVLLVIGLGMGAFILMDLMSASGSRKGVTNIVLKVFEDEYDLTEFQQRVQNVSKNQQNQDRSISDVRDSEFNSFKREKIFENQFNKLSIEVSKEENKDMIYGDNVHPVLKQSEIFINPETGLFDNQLVVEYLQNVAQDQTGQGEISFRSFEKQIQYARKEQKYNVLLFQSSYVTEDFALSTYKNQNSFRDVSYISIPITTIPDSFIAISNSEIKDYLKNNSDQYQQEESRSFSYVVFDIVPSEIDSNIAKMYLENIKEEWLDFESNDSANSIFVNKYSDGNMSDFYNISIEELTNSYISKNSLLYNNQIYGPVVSGEGYSLLKIHKQDASKLEKEQYLDSIRVSVIFKNIFAGSQSRKKVFAEAGSFCTNNNNKKLFNQAVIDLGLTKRIKEEMKKGETNIVGLNDPNEIISWINEANEGDVSSVFSLDEKFVVVCLDLIKEKGTKDINEVETEIKSILIKKQKENIIIEEINTANYNSLSDLIDIFGGEIKNIKQISFNDSQIPGLGQELDFIGSVFATDKGSLTKPIKGQSNIYVANVDSISNPVDSNFYGVLDQLKNMSKNRSLYDAFIALEKQAEVIDNRINLNYY